LEDDSFMAARKWMRSVDTTGPQGNLFHHDQTPLLLARLFRWPVPVTLAGAATASLLPGIYFD
jgi:hypothetical protein